MFCEEVPLWPCGAAAKGASNMVKRITTILFAALFCGFFGISIAAAEQNPSPAIDGDTKQEYPDNKEPGRPDDHVGGDGDNDGTDNGGTPDEHVNNDETPTNDGSDDGTGGGTSDATPSNSTAASPSETREDSCNQSHPATFERSNRARACSNPLFRL